MSPRLPARGLIAAAFVACVSDALLAQADCRRCLGDHRFIVSTAVPDPFVSTLFVSGTGAGMAVDLTVPVRDIDGAVVDSLKGDIAFLLLDLTYQYAVTRIIAVRANVTAVGRVGTSTEALIASGASALYGGSLGATGQVWRNRVIAIAATLDTRRHTEYDIDPYAFVRQVVDSGYTPESKETLLRDAAVTSFSGGVRVGWAAFRWLGVRSVIEFGATQRPADEGGYASLTEYSLLADADIGAVTKVPIGLSLGYRGQHGPGGGGVVSGTTHLTEAGIFYTGRLAFQIGLDLLWAQIKLPQRSVTSLDAMQARLVTRFDF
jgi:hypothetical protein